MSLSVSIQHLFIMSFVLFVLFCTLFLSLPSAVSGIPNFPRSAYEYFLQRDALLESEQTFEGRHAALSEDERVVDHFLGYLKWKEMKRTVSGEGFLSSLPIEEVLPIIRSSELYQHLVKFPKGGNLHSHESQHLSKKVLFDILWKCKDFDHLYVILPRNKAVESDKVWYLDFFVNPPEDENWVKVKDSGFSKEQLLLTTNFVDAMNSSMRRRPTNSKARWNLLKKLFFRSSSTVIDNIEVKREYLLALYRESMEEGVVYLETRRLYGFDSLYELDFTGASRATNGKKYLNEPDLSFEMEMILEQVDRFKSQNPRFIGHKVILSAFRSKSREAFQRNFDDAILLRGLYPKHVIGFDLSNEEDDGYSNLYFVENFLAGNGSMPLYLHSVETNWPDDLLVGSKEDDLLPPLQNAYEAVILQTKRVGHGKGFFKKPYLRSLLKERNVVIEVCLTSNQILGYDPDLRNHFGQLFYREGIPIVLGSDDQAPFGWNDGMVLDWYAAFTSWGLNLGDLKRLALNSLEFSGMREDEKKEAVDDYWTSSWSEYISKMKELACARDFEKEAALESRSVKFNRVMPGSGPQGTKVYLFGRNFELAICKSIRCLFGNKSSDAAYVSNQLLTCRAPQCPHCRNLSATVSVVVGGKTFPTNSHFVYASTLDADDSSNLTAEIRTLVVMCLTVAIVSRLCSVLIQRYF